MVICLVRGANDLHIVQLLPLLSCFFKIHYGLTFLVPVTQVALKKKVSVCKLFVCLA